LLKVVTLASERATQCKQLAFNAFHKLTGFHQH
jgi:hypothetical protein